jgi:predicted dehydrogenase
MTVHLGIIGVGNIGLQHANNILSGVIQGCIITAISARGACPLAEQFNIPQYLNYKELIDKQVCDAVIVATPTCSHLEIGCYALSRGLHVLMEKPIGLSVAEGERMLELVQSKQVFGLMLNQRADPVEEHPPYDVWCTADEDYILLKASAGGYMQTHYELTELIRDEVGE